jgi:hypothetical protein
LDFEFLIGPTRASRPKAFDVAGQSKIQNPKSKIDTAYLPSFSPPPGRPPERARAGRRVDSGSP